MLTSRAYLTWRGVDVARGTIARMRGALRPCGRAAGGPREAQEAHKARTRGRMPRVSTQPCGRPCGHHVAGEGRQMEGPRVSGPW